MPFSWTVDTVSYVGVEETRLWNELELSLRVQRSDLDSLRAVLNTSGKVARIETGDGGFRSVDRLAGITKSAKFTASADNRSSVRPVDSWFVKDYEEEVVSSDGTVWLVTLVLVPDIQKSPGSKYSTISSPPSESDTSDKWYFEFDRGDILTGRVTASLTSSPSRQRKTISLSIVLSETEVRVVEESCGLLSAVVVRDVSDGNTFVKNQASPQNVVSISPPSGADKTVPPGEYVVASWETVYNSASYVVTLEVVKV